MFEKLKIRTSLFIASATVVTFTTLVLVGYFSLWGGAAAALGHCGAAE